MPKIYFIFIVSFYINQSPIIKQFVKKIGKILNHLVIFISLILSLINHFRGPILSRFYLASKVVLRYK